MSGVVRDAFIAAGHKAISCDLIPCAAPGPHIVGDVLGVVGDGFDLMVAHPPCTYLSSSGLHWNTRRPDRAAKTEAALVFVRALMACDIPKICIENPVGRIGTAIRPADQYVHPYQFGHDASKRTGFWLKGLPLLRPTSFVEPRWVDGGDYKMRPRWANQTDSGQNRLAPSAGRAAERSTTYSGIARAMAAQWNQ